MLRHQRHDAIEGGLEGERRGVHVGRDSVECEVAAHTHAHVEKVLALEVFANRVREIVEPVLGGAGFLGRRVANVHLDHVPVLRRVLRIHHHFGSGNVVLAQHALCKTHRVRRLRLRGVGVKSALKNVADALLDLRVRGGSGGGRHDTLVHDRLHGDRRCGSAYLRARPFLVRLDVVVIAIVVFVVLLIIHNNRGRRRDGRSRYRRLRCLDTDLVPVTHLVQFLDNGISVHIKTQTERHREVVAKLVGALVHQIGHRVSVLESDNDGAVGMVDEEAHHDVVLSFVSGTCEGWMVPKETMYQPKGRRGICRVSHAVRIVRRVTTSCVVPLVMDSFQSSSLVLHLRNKPFKPGGLFTYLL